MRCQTCKLERIASINSKSSDCNFIQIGERDHDGYVLTGMGIGRGDYIEFSWCLDCGQIQGGFPLPLVGDLEVPTE